MPRAARLAIGTADAPLASWNGAALLTCARPGLHRGECFIILGGSGCGKSTMLKHMIGLYEPFSGRVLIRGEDITASTGAPTARNSSLASCWFDRW